MKKLILTAVVGAAALSLGACSSEPAADETVVETESPAPEELAPAADASPTDGATDAAAESPAAEESPAA